MKLTISALSLGAITIFGFQNCSPTSMNAMTLQENAAASFDPNNVHNLSEKSQDFIVLNTQVARFLNDYARICSMQIEESHDSCLIVANIIAQEENLIRVMENPSNDIHVIASMIPAMYDFVQKYETGSDESVLSFPIERIQSLIPVQRTFLTDLSELNSKCMEGDSISCDELYQTSGVFLNNFFAMWSSEMPPTLPQPDDTSP